MNKKSPSWPETLKRPIVLNEILARVRALGLSEKDERTAFQNLFANEYFRRMKLIVEHLGFECEPENDDDWIKLVFRLCNHWNIPAFQIVDQRPRPRGASKLWTNTKLCELFADVQQLLRGKNEMSESAACAYIAKNPKIFGSRYQIPTKSNEDAWKKTIHRQYINAKKNIKINNLFIAAYLFEDESGLLRGLSAINNGWDAKVETAIRRYAFARKFREN